jgi:hypothetical protein
MAPRTPAPVFRLGQRQLQAIVYALHFRRIAGFDGRDAQLLAHGQADDVGQVILALDVARPEPGEPGLEETRARNQHAGVDLVDAPLFLAGVAFLDDPQQLAARVAQHAAIAAGVRQLRGQQREGARSTLRDQSAQRVGQQQRHIAVQHQHLVCIGNIRHRLLQGISGAELFGLQRPAQQPILEQFAHALATVPIDHMDRSRREAGGQIEHMREHRCPGQRLQHLGDLGLHALALARRQYDDRQRCGRRCGLLRGLGLLARHREIVSV